MEAYRRDASSKDQLISELKSTKKRLLTEVKDLKQELMSVQGEKQNAELEQARLAKEVTRVQEQMNNMEVHLQAIQTERDQLETQIQVTMNICITCSILLIKFTLRTLTIKCYFLGGEVEALEELVNKPPVSGYSVNPIVM